MQDLGFNKPIKDTKIVVAMSGGIDSSVAAISLKKMGYEVIGITMKLYNQSEIVKESKSCCAGKDIKDAVEIAKQFNFPHHTLNLQDIFFEKVINNFTESYAKGETPIPCIKCNQTVKFTDMLNVAKKMKADALVTGHYARIMNNDNLNKDIKLFRALDSSKDQTYFLFATTKSQLNYLRFPLGNYKKQEIRDFAKDLDIKIKDKPDSQDICFVTEGSYSKFISKLSPESFIEGNIVDTNDNILGRHEGIANFTIGQRKKIGIGGNIEPFYVLNINSKNNTIIVGSKKDLKKTKIFVEGLNWISNDVSDNMVCDAKIRSTQKPKSGRITFENENRVIFEFDESQLNTSAGQACVFYRGDEVLGGGWIKSN
tara:strand:+ start:5755 stop:6864 length:1110 start_codon:yes stop_codon:yes gene_type:complete